MGATAIDFMQRSCSGGSRGGPFFLISTAIVHTTCNTALAVSTHLSDSVHSWSHRWITVVRTLEFPLWDQR